MNNNNNNNCNLKLEIPIDKVNQIFSELANNYEISGIISCESDNNVNITMNKGNKDSVITPNHVINYHTHPISAYNEGETTWGWPSGEDIRETMKFALAGNKAHLVFTVEGLYTIQISPCKIKKMKKLTKEQIGVLIFIIEEYFKTTHNFRGVEDVEILNDKKIIITPSSYVDFINNFDLINLRNAKTIFHKKSKHHVDSFGERFTRIPNIGFPELKDGAKIANLTMGQYMKYNEIQELRNIDPEGNEYKSTVKDIEHLVLVFKEILEIFNTNECNVTWNNKPNSWFFVNFFPTEYYLSKMFNDGHSSTYRSPSREDLHLLQIKETPYIKIFSNKKDGCSTEEIRKINNFKIVQNTRNTRNTRNGVKLQQNTFGESDLTSQQIILLIKNMELNPNSGLFEISKKLGISDSQINKLLNISF